MKKLFLLTAMSFIANIASAETILTAKENININADSSITNILAGSSHSSLDSCTLANGKSFSGKTISGGAQFEVKSVARKIYQIRSRTDNMGITINGGSGVEFDANGMVLVNQEFRTPSLQEIARKGILALGVFNNAEITNRLNAIKTVEDLRTVLAEYNAQPRGTDDEIKNIKMFMQKIDIKSLKTDKTYKIFCEFEFADKDNYSFMYEEGKTLNLLNEGLFKVTVKPDEL
jgi:hypothetical protein